MCWPSPVVTGLNSHIQELKSVRPFFESPSMSAKHQRSVPQTKLNEETPRDEPPRRKL